jgi:hypothetical protein
LREVGRATYRTGVPGPALSFLLALAAAAGGTAAGAPAEPVEQRREEVARELVQLGQELRRAIVAGDTRAIAARVPEDGLRCAGRTVPRAKVLRDLGAPGSWLHETFFGRSGGTQARSPASLAELLRDVPDVVIAVSFTPDPRAGPLGRPCIDFRAKNVATPGAPLCFEQRAGRWWFTESLYPCG